MKVLLVQVIALGDVCRALPAPAAIGQVLPGARVTWLVGASCAGLLDGDPSVARRLVVDDRRLYAGGPIARIGAVLGLAGRLEAAYDLILIGHRSRGYPLALGALTAGPIFQLDRRPPTDRPASRRTAVHAPPRTVSESRHLERLVARGLEAVLGRPIDRLPWRWSAAHLAGAGPDLGPRAVALHVGGGSNVKTSFPEKVWPHGRRLVEALLDRTSATIVLVGAEGDRPAADRIASGRTGSGRLVDLVGRTDLAELAAVLGRCRVVVGVDSGPLHLADALGVATIGLFGPTSPLSWGVVGPAGRSLVSETPCAPCYDDGPAFPPCPIGARCMRELPVERVLGAILDRLPLSARAAAAGRGPRPASGRPARGPSGRP